MKTFLVLSVCVFLSTVLGVRHDSHHGNDTSQDIYKKCPLQLNTKLPGMNCSVSRDYLCGEITCSAVFSHVDIKLTMQINKVDEWPGSLHLEAWVSLSVPELKIDWWRSFKDGDKLKVPWFPLKVEGFEGADVFLQVSLNKENGIIHFKVDLHAIWSNLTTERTYSATIFAGKVVEDSIATIAVCHIGPYPSDDDDQKHPFHKRSQVLPTFAKGLIAMAVCALVLFSIVIAIFYHFKKKSPTTIQVKPSKPPSYEEATCTKTKVPMQPLVNEV